MYICSATSISIFCKINQNNNEEEKRSRITGTGVSQKDLQITEITEKEKKAKKLVEKRMHALQACSRGSDKLEKRLH